MVRLFCGHGNRYGIDYANTEQDTDSYKHSISHTNPDSYADRYTNHVRHNEQNGIGYDYPDIHTDTNSNTEPDAVTFRGRYAVSYTDIIADADTVRHHIRDTLQDTDGHDDILCHTNTDTQSNSIGYTVEYADT